MTLAEEAGLTALLARYAGGAAEGWTLAPTRLGEMRASFLATRPGRRLFLKHPADTRGAARLAELSVTPPLVAAGVWRGEPFVLHDWREGSSPDRAWLRTHAATVARLMRRYHADAPLRAALAATADGEPYPPQPADHPAHVARELAAIALGLAAAAAPELRDPAVRAAVRRFHDRAGSLPPAPLVATHGDPNPANLLLAGETVFLVDWDAAALSDPLRDLALFAWWFLPPGEWPAFLSAYDSRQDGPRRVAPEVVGWWAARGSLRVALWLDAHGRDPGKLRSFIADFLAAEAGAPNPKLEAEG